MDILEVIGQVRALLQQEGRVSYRILKRQFALDDEALDDLKFELIEVRELATDKDGKMLVWTGGDTVEAAQDAPPTSSTDQSHTAEQSQPAGERRQLTVMFCDLVGSTALSEQLDPEELQAVVRIYQEVSARVIERYEGYIAQYLGDGLLVYFGYPAAHEDNAARAIRAGVEIVNALDQARSQFLQPVQVRIGIHTGPVVVGQMGGGSRYEQLALGETPNIAARLQSKAEPDEVVISAATQRLVVGLFETQDRGQHELKGISTPHRLYRVVGESSVKNRFEVAIHSGLPPLVGRAAELQLLQQRWAQAQTGAGQAVIVSGEPGLGKSRLVQALKERVAPQGATHIAFRCSPYHQNSAWYPIIGHIEHLLQFAPGDMPETKLGKLQQTLRRYRFPQANTVPLLAALLSLPQPMGVPPLTMSPQKQKEQTQATLVEWLFEEAGQAAVVCTWEDLHWADPSTLELLTLCLAQIPTARMLALLVFRPEFTLPWGTRSYLSQLTLSRLDRAQVERMVEQATGGKALPSEVMQHVIEKTDGVPLFVEELTKMVLESGIVWAVNHHYELTGPLSALEIPSTLHDSLMARLDRLATAKEVAQLGATIGREFSYELLQAVSPLDEATLRHGVQQLVDAELVYQRGVPPDAQYLFKHALVQDTAYQSLLKTTRQHYHQQIIQVLEAQFAATVEAHPELVAYHYTAAEQAEQAIPYWQQAGQKAVGRSAHAEAIHHLSNGLALLNALSDTPPRIQHELQLRIALGGSLMATKGYSAPEVASNFIRARELCQKIGEMPQLFPILRGLRLYYSVRGEHRTGRQLGEQMLTLARNLQDRSLLLEAHVGLESPLFWSGELALARKHAEQGIALYDSQKHRSHAVLYGQDPGASCLLYAALALSHLGYPDLASKRAEEALALAQELTHPFSLAFTLFSAATVYSFCRQEQAVYETAQAVIALSTEQGFPMALTIGTYFQGWSLAKQGQREQGIADMQHSLAALQTMGSMLTRSFMLALLAETYGAGGEAEKGLAVLTEAFAVVAETGEHNYEAELYRLKGELLLNGERRTMNDERRTCKADARHTAKAEACFQQAIEIAQQQEAKSWELRAATSLARLWQQQGKTTEAKELLGPVYDWFTEGFDTVDLKDAKALLTELSEGV